MKISIAQLSPSLGNINVNLALIENACESALKEGSDLIVFSELFLTGYPPKDLLLSPYFKECLSDAIEDLIKLSRSFSGLGILVGLPFFEDNLLYNGAFFLENGKVIAKHRKQLLPNYDVFDEYRYFVPGISSTSLVFKGFKMGLTICEDIWFSEGPQHISLKQDNPIENLSTENCDLIINIAASPFERGKPSKRQEILSSHAMELKCPILYVNQIGAYDELIFDGHSLLMTAEGQLKVSLNGFEKQLSHFSLYDEVLCDHSDEKELSHVYSALVLGLSDYVHRCGFKKVVLGISGGIDSALVAAIAVAALGAENVVGIAMPSVFSSEGSLSDARQLAKNLGISLKEISIDPIRERYHNAFKTLFDKDADKCQSLTLENIQARIRGDLLMAYSNESSSLLLTTGNKTEVAVGYCTLYGDMCGALNVIGDLYKEDVYSLSRFMNLEKIVIPETIIKKAPSAELRPDQFDEDSLMAYKELDVIVRFIIEEDEDLQKLIDKGYQKEDYEKVYRLIRQNEYKRQQSSPILKVSKKAFGSGRRVMITRS